MSELRWQAATVPAPQLRLLDTARRKVGRGEYRGLEFLEVEAKRLINPVPNQGRLPFAHTINAYRGCSHACAYCLSGDTPILMADGRTKPIAEVRCGDAVYGTIRRGSYRRYVPTAVLDHWSTVKPGYRVTLEDGTQLIASGDHRFLSDRGWKHVTGADQGFARRPHLTTNNSLRGVGAFAATPKETGDYRQGYLCGLIRGDAHLGTYPDSRPERRRSAIHRFRLALADREALDRARTYLSERGVSTTTFCFQAATDTRREMLAIRTQARAAVDAVRSLVSWPASPSTEWRRGFLAGIFDAEGSHSRGVLRIYNTDPQILRSTASSLSHFGFLHRLEDRRQDNGLCSIRLLGGLPERLRFFHTVDPAITRKRTIDNVAIKHTATLQVMDIERLGFDLPMYDITTGTGDFIADGVVSHNCFARPTHEYLGLDLGRDFETKIVVKVNAVELARAETAPGRWGGELIAMGTNTDPYQPAEGKYRLTRGVVEVLSERRNPFSILTKSPLALRDLDVLAEAARVTDVSVDFSVGTLDEDVWRLTEPSAPHPRRRIEAVARLNEEGITSGVLIGPVLPGLSDNPEQLEAVVAAAIDAGAVSVGAVLLHLKPGVKDHYLGFLGEHRPDLVGRHVAMYRGRSYAASSEQRRLSDLVSDLVARHGGVAGRWKRARPRPSQPEPRPQQLSLGV